MPQGQLYTVGHSTQSMKSFVALLKQHNISCVIDVRSTPYSKYAPQFNKDCVDGELGLVGINYAYMGNVFGARQANVALYADDGILDFDRVREMGYFRDRVKTLQAGLLLGERLALMCVEKHPIDCHRAVLVARGFELAGVNVQHILADGSLLSQEDLNIMLLDKYHPDREQTTLSFCEGEPTEEELLSDAYKKRNKEIGYRLPER